MAPHPMPMSAETLYQAIRDTIDDQLQLDDELTTFELIGVVRLIEGELVAAAVGDSDDEGEEEGEELD
jgi:hypothetical protein